MTPVETRKRKSFGAKEQCRTNKGKHLGGPLVSHTPCGAYREDMPTQCQDDSKAEQMGPPRSNREDAARSANKQHNETATGFKNENQASPPPSVEPPRQPKTIPFMTRVRIGAVRAFLMAWVRCFSLSGLYQLGRFFGTVEFLIDYNRRRRVNRKLLSFFKDEFPNDWRRRATWRYFMRIRCDKMFYTIIDRIPRDKLMNRIKRVGWEHLDDALAQKKGVYFALCHFGSHHVAALIMALLGYELAGVRDPKESPVRRYIQEKYRETFPEMSRVKLFHATSFPRDIYRHLKNNGILASLLDADRKRSEQTRTFPVTVFGEEREFLVGPLQMAIRCGATTLQGFVISRRNFYYELVVTPPLIDPKTVTDESETIANVIQLYADSVEQFAREHPDHLMNI